MSRKSHDIHHGLMRYELFKKSEFAMQKYRFRFFLDPGSGTCLWSADDHTKAEYDYPVDHRRLHLPENTFRALQHLIAWFDTSVDWEYPPNPGPWTPEEADRFSAYKASILALVRTQLGTDYEIVDESQY